VLLREVRLNLVAGLQRLKSSRIPSHVRDAMLRGYLRDTRVKHRLEVSQVVKELTGAGRSRAALARVTREDAYRFLQSGQLPDALLDAINTDSKGRFLRAITLHPMRLLSDTADEDVVGLIRAAVLRVRRGSGPESDA
jgi:hypothetical protein